MDTDLFDPRGHDPLPLPIGKLVFGSGASASTPFVFVSVGPCAWAANLDQGRCLPLLPCQTDQAKASPDGYGLASSPLAAFQSLPPTSGVQVGEAQGVGRPPDRLSHGKWTDPWRSVLMPLCLWPSVPSG